LARFFRFGSIFSGLALFFSIWVWFGFFSFRLIKPNRTSRFFQNFNRFNRLFFTVWFFQLFFFCFLGFSVFLLISNTNRLMGRHTLLPAEFHIYQLLSNNAKPISYRGWSSSISSIKISLWKWIRYWFDKARFI
jgi:hypothetical protein